MNLKALTLVLLLASPITVHAYDVTLQAGDLDNSNGSAALPVSQTADPNDGSLILVLSTGTDSTFSNTLTAGEYYSSSDVLLQAFAANNGAGSTDGTASSFSFASSAGGQNQAIEIRWFPQLTYNQFLADTDNGVNSTGLLLLAGDNYGDYAGPTTDGAPGTNAGDAWLIPAGSGAVNLNFVTQSFNTFDTSGGFGLTDAEPDIDGFASSVVTGVPEPSIVILFVMSALGILFATRRRKLCRA